MTSFGQQLHTTRTALGMTQDDLAIELGVDKQTVSNWECERTQPWPNKKVDVLTRLIELQRLRPIYDEDFIPAPVRERIIDRI